MSLTEPFPRIGPAFAFRGKAIQVCPLTSDYAYLEQAGTP